MKHGLRMKIEVDLEHMQTNQYQFHNESGKQVIKNTKSLLTYLEGTKNLKKKKIEEEGFGGFT